MGQKKRKNQTRRELFLLFSIIHSPSVPPSPPSRSPTNVVVCKNMYFEQDILAKKLPLPSKACTICYVLRNKSHLLLPNPHPPPLFSKLPGAAANFLCVDKSVQMWSVLFCRGEQIFSTETYLQETVAVISPWSHRTQEEGPPCTPA